MIKIELKMTFSQKSTSKITAYQLISCPFLSLMVLGSLFQFAFFFVVRVHQLKIIYTKFSMLSKGCVCTKHKRIRSGHDDKLKIHFEQVYELMFNLYTD